MRFGELVQDAGLSGSGKLRWIGVGGAEGHGVGDFGVSGGTSGFFGARNLAAVYGEREESRMALARRQGRH